MPTMMYGDIVTTAIRGDFVPKRVPSLSAFLKCNAMPHPQLCDIGFSAGVFYRWLICQCFRNAFRMLGSRTWCRQ